MICNLCPNLCNVDRIKQLGKCGIGDEIYIARHALHFWEEPIISGTKGSGTIFFSGCTMRCIFCQNHKISRKAYGEKVTVERLAEIIEELDKVAHNINFVTPTHFADKIIEALNIYKPKNPVVYNTSGYETTETIKKLNGYVNIYLPDLKYVNSDISKKLSNRKDYFKFALPAINAMCEQVGKPVIENGIMKKGVIVRHLIIPSYIQNTLDVLRVFADNFKDRAMLSVMSQYTPCNVENFPKLNRTITPLEYKRVLFELEKLKIENGFIQELSSATTKYIPDF